MDEYTPYRYYYAKTVSRGKCALSLNDIKTLWEKQKGICALSGLPMQLRKKNRRNDMFTVASLDRIDSSKAYEPGNIQFVILSLNLGKNDASNDAYMEFLRKLKQ